MFGKAAMALLKANPIPSSIASTDIRTLEKILKEVSNKRIGRAKAEAVKAAAKESVGVPFATSSLAFEIRHVVELIEFLDQQIEEIDAEISRMLQETSGKWLTTIPGVGDVLAATIIGELGDPNRFESPKKSLFLSVLMQVKKTRVSLKVPAIICPKQVHPTCAMRFSLQPIKLACLTLILATTIIRL